MMWSTFRRTMLAIQFVHESQQLLGPARERGGRQTVAPSMHPQLVCPKFCLSVSQPPARQVVRFDCVF